MSRLPVGVILALIVLVVPAGRAAAAGPASDAEVAELPAPLTADLHRVLDAPTSAWRSPAAEVYRWDLFPDILILDSASFAIQNRMFTRLAYYLEKRGHRGQLLGNGWLAGRHGWNAHDYGAAGLADFFNAAAAASFPLNPEEVALRRLALRERIIVAARGEYAPGRGGVLGISRSSSRVERELLLTHESFHGVFFSSAEYRAYCEALWASLSPDLKSFYERFLDSLGYDVTAPTLVVNEFQAYLMQQPLAYAESYFERFLRLREGQGSAAPVQPWQLRKNAEELDAFCRERFGFGAGGLLLASLGGRSR
jgi:hypothetical protein